MQHLDITSSDSVFAITSAGDNVLHYVIASSPRNVSYLLELKLAAISSLEYSDFFALFGRGYHPRFRDLLDSKLKHRLSIYTYEFWKANASAFLSSTFYDWGYSGRALWFVRLLFKLAGVYGEVERLCDLWLNPLMVALLRNPIFCWNALGVPLNQQRMLLDEGGVYQYICDTLDPILSTYLLKTQNYFYLLALLGHYTPECCPSYLSHEGFDKLKAKNCECLNAFRIYTETIFDILHELPSSSLTRVLLMDHMDWYDPSSNELKNEAIELSRVLAPSGLVFWRSASRYPWYNQVFTLNGFQVMPVNIRQPGTAIPLDKVNMYASFWQVEKIKWSE
ncbi:hypothetical protein F5876DRAFT_91122 [Lentinula aff. lateritia]|uniref:Uncharacterized protein n=1 Tax=Lentinula aff. lateritia TaxID=2804960 RepID=A0ACC1TNU9_9AGAR|nr:hypothetical protein F5876DRAFT_91122 [Lentinula aff. lateritia]